VDVYLHNPVFSCLVGILTVQLELYVKCPNFPPNKFVVLFFNTEDGGTIFLRNNGILLQQYTVSGARIPRFGPKSNFAFSRMVTEKSARLIPPPYLTGGRDFRGLSQLISLRMSG